MKSVPLKRMASSQNFFVWFCGVLICKQGLIPHNKILRGIRPRRTKSCGVSDPTEQGQSCVHCSAYTCSAGSDTPQNNVLWGLIPCLTKFCGHQTPRNKVLRGIKPRGTTFKNEYFCEFKKEFKYILECEFGDYMGSIRRKKQRLKSSATVPLRPVTGAGFPTENGKKDQSSLAKYYRFTVQDVVRPAHYRELNWTNEYFSPSILVNTRRSCYFSQSKEETCEWALEYCIRREILREMWEGRKGERWGEKDRKKRPNRDREHSDRA